MYTCFKCKKKFDLSGIKTHLKHLHTFDNTSLLNTYLCGEENCYKHYSHLKSYMRHLRNEHPLPQFDSRSNEFQKSVSMEIDTPKESREVDHQIVFQLPVPNSAPEDNNGSLDLDNVHCNTDYVAHASQELAVASFCSKLYNNHSLPRNKIQEIIEDTSELVAAVLRIHLKDDPAPPNIFEGFQTEYQRLKYFQTRPYFIKPRRFVLGQRDESEMRSDGEVIVKVTDCTGEFVPLRDVLRCVFEIPGVYNVAKNYMADECSLEGADFKDSPIWKQKRMGHAHREKENVFPILLFADDFQVLNPLGSQTSVYKITGVYYLLLCFPPEHRSKLENIFVAMLYHSQDRSNFGNERTYQILIEELAYLETEGIEINLDGKFVKIYFMLGLITGDNLGLNEILGFTGSFSANHYCRICILHRNEALEATKEDPNKLRNRTNYQLHVEKEDVTTTGITSACCFNEIPSFHVTDNWVLDIMHDLFEGVLRYLLAFILLYFINENFFTLETFNYRVQHFNFGRKERNKPPSIIMNQIVQGKIIMSAAEMSNLFLFLGLIIGDLIPEGDLHWKLYLQMREIIDILFQNEVNIKESANALRVLVDQFLQLFLQLGGSMKPKFHLLTHYATAMEKVGNMKNYWAMRFESKHSELKAVAKTINCRKNLCYSIASREQLKFYYRIESKIGLRLKTETGNLSSTDTPFLEDSHMFSDSLIPDIQINCLSTDFVIFKGKEYAINDCIILHFSDKLPVFGIIKHILLNLQGRVTIVCQKLSTLRLDYHFHSYGIAMDQNNSYVTIENFNFIANYILHIVTANNGQKYAASKVLPLHKSD